MENQIWTKSGFSARLSKFNENYFIFYALAGVGLILSFLTPNFLTATNIMTIFKQSSIIAIVAAGQFFVLTGGDFDLSVGPIVSLSGVIFAGAMVNYGIAPPVAFLFALALGLIVGAVNGFMVAKVGLPSFIATMATMIS